MYNTMVRTRKEKTFVSLDPEVSEAINKARGTIPKSTFINDVLYFAFVATDEQVEAVKSFDL
jgi:hypothetical protein